MLAGTQQTAARWGLGQRAKLMDVPQVLLLQKEQNWRELGVVFSRAFGIVPIPMGKKL